jgi:single-strand DNA-binding protein
MDSDALPRINRVIVTGFLQQEPELRHTPSGVAVASFRVRSGRMVRDRRGAGRETVSYFTVVVWADLAQRICRDVRNGQGVYVEGSLHSRSFVASSGERKTVVEIYADDVEPVPVFLPVREGRPGDRPREGEPSATFDGAEHPPMEHPDEASGFEQEH